MKFILFLFDEVSGVKLNGCPPLPLKLISSISYFSVIGYEFEPEQLNLHSTLTSSLIIQLTKKENNKRLIKERLKAAVFLLKKENEQAAVAEIKAI